MRLTDKKQTMGKNPIKNAKEFKKGESGNPNGRPKKTVNVILEQLADAGYQIPTPNQIKDTYLYLVTMPQDELKKLVDDKETPMLHRICATNILSKRGFDILERMLDRAIGKATQKTELTGEDGEKVDFVINVIHGTKILPYEPD